MAGEMGLAVFAAEDLVGVEVGVVDEAHPHHLKGPESWNLLTVMKWIDRF